MVQMDSSMGGVGRDIPKRTRAGEKTRARVMELIFRKQRPMKKMWNSYAVNQGIQGEVQPGGTTSP